MFSRFYFTGGDEAAVAVVIRTRPVFFTATGCTFTLLIPFVAWCGGVIHQSIDRGVMHTHNRGWRLQPQQTGAHLFPDLGSRLVWCAGVSDAGGVAAGLWMDEVCVKEATAFRRGESVITPFACVGRGTGVSFLSSPLVICVPFTSTRGAAVQIEEAARLIKQAGEWSSTEPFTTTIHLPPGTHHFRFIVDGQTLVAPATEIPNAVDDQGFIANYVAVPGPVVSPAAVSPSSATASTGVPSAQTSATVSPSASTGGRARRRRPSLPVHPDGSFWAQSSAGGSGEDVRLAARVLAGRGSGGHDGGHRGGWSGGWTSDIPEALVAAAAQEEAWIDAQAQYDQHHQQHQQQHYRHANGDDGSRGNSRGRHIVLNGFVPEPSFPMAPRLPRHLERLILNRPSPGVVIPRVGTGAVASGSSMNQVGVEATPSPSPSPALRVTTASGTDVSVPMMSFASAGNADRPASNASGSGTSTPNPATHPQFGASAQARATTSGMGTPLIADDPSVLQTPSHAVLYHLCTSSIRDKMIAVGASTRYRQKYLTTVYYKPAEPTTKDLYPFFASISISARPTGPASDTHPYPPQNAPGVRPLEWHCCILVPQGAHVLAIHRPTLIDTKRMDDDDDDP
ncbi:5'-AMP-activated protein kinase beta subunit, interation domain-containing protein [Mycena galopus ATCC 62051]|nr:5'-AMP-activated protein kinase beta subunit, interation domain-containing protein [Mycena galopus ATCC 62051]